MDLECDIDKCGICLEVSGHFIYPCVCEHRSAVHEECLEAERFNYGASACAKCRKPFNLCPKKNFEVDETSVIFKIAFMSTVYIFLAVAIMALFQGVIISFLCVIGFSFLEAFQWSLLGSFVGYFVACICLYFVAALSVPNGDPFVVINIFYCCELMPHDCDCDPEAAGPAAVVGAFLLALTFMMLMGYIIYRMAVYQWRKHIIENYYVGDIIIEINEIELP